MPRRSRYGVPRSPRSTIRDQNTLLIDSALRSLGMTQAQLADALGVTQSAVSQMRGSRTRLKPPIVNAIKRLVVAAQAARIVQGNMPVMTEDGLCIRPIDEDPATFFAHLPLCEICLAAAYRATTGVPDYRE